MKNPPGFEENTHMIELPDRADDLGLVECFERLHRERFAWVEGLGWLANVGDYWEAPDAESRLWLAIRHFYDQLAEAVDALPEGARKAEWESALRRMWQLQFPSARGAFVRDARTGLAGNPDAFEADPTSLVRVSVGKRGRGATRYTRYFARK